MMLLVRTRRVLCPLVGFLGLVLTVAAIATAEPAPAQTDPGTTEEPPDSSLDLGDPTELAGLIGGVVVVEQMISANQVDEFGVGRSLGIVGSFNENTGVFLVNQDAGNFNNQANVVAIAIASAETLAQTLSISVEQRREHNAVVSVASPAEISIDGSFNGTRGVVAVNQSTGSGNNQLNALVLGIGLVAEGDVVVVNDNDLSAERGSDELPIPEVLDSGTLVDSFQGFEGIAQVSQVNGSLNDVSNVLSVSVSSLQGPP